MSDTTELSDARSILIEKYLQGVYPPSAIGLSDIASSARAEEVDARESVVAIQTGGTRQPFFFLQGDWIGGASWCFPLARDLGPDQPFYTLEPYNFDGLPVPPDLETIAAAHLKSMRTIQPEGPYSLGGFCNGGLLAYEMARQLYREGQKLDLLVLIDPMGLIYPMSHRLARTLLNWTGKLMQLSQEKPLNGYILLRHLYSYLRFSDYRKSEAARPCKLGERIGLEGKRNKGDLTLPRLDSIFPPVEFLRQDYPAIYDWSAMRYTPQDLYPGKITFFWFAEELWHRKGWRKVFDTNEVEVHILPGEQMESKTQNLHVLAKHLSACLGKAQAADPI